MSNSEFIAVILAAGKGTRMQSTAPKVLSLLEGKSLLHHVLENIAQAGIKKKILIVGYGQEKVKEAVAVVQDTCEYVLQEKQLGTGHAVLCTEEVLNKYGEGSFLVTAGDMPLLTSTSFKKLYEFHKKNHYFATVLSAIVENPYGYGRIIRNKEKDLEYIVEEKDASTEEKKVYEINTGTYILEFPKVFCLLRQLDSNNAQNEFYLPDIIALSKKNSYPVGAFSLADDREAYGVNSPEDLAKAHELYHLLKTRKPNVI